MFSDEFKERYTTIPLAVYRGESRLGGCCVLSHQHREAELISVTLGRIDFYVDSELYTLERGDVLFIPPYSVHRAEKTGDEPCEYDCICFDPELLWDEGLKSGLLDQSVSAEHIAATRAACSDKLQRLISEGCSACECSDDGWEMRAIGSVSLVFGILKSQGFLRSDPRVKPKSSFSRRVMEYISENYTASITSADAARALYMNNSYFCRLFKRVFGCSFSDYVLSYRLEKAKIYLNNTNSTVTEIAFSTGFHGSSYFCKSFKARFGVSPLSLRKGN